MGPAQSSVQNSERNSLGKWLRTAHLSAFQQLPSWRSFSFLLLCNRVKHFTASVTWLARVWWLFLPTDWQVIPNRGTLQNASCFTVRTKRPIQNANIWIGEGGGGEFWLSSLSQETTWWKCFFLRCWIPCSYWRLFDIGCCRDEGLALLVSWTGRKLELAGKIIISI